MATVVNDAHLFSVKRMIELSRLNASKGGNRPSLTVGAFFAPVMYRLAGGISDVSLVSTEGLVLRQAANQAPHLQLEPAKWPTCAPLRKPCSGWRRIALSGSLSAGP